MGSYLIGLITFVCCVSIFYYYRGEVLWILLLLCLSYQYKLIGIVIYVVGSTKTLSRCHRSTRNIFNWLRNFAVVILLLRNTVTVAAGATGGRSAKTIKYSAENNVNHYYFTRSILQTEVLTNHSLPSWEIYSLYDLYNRTNGIHWEWWEPYSQYGIPWNFSTINTTTNASPCADHWQGITCSVGNISSTSYNVEYAHVIKLDLSNNLIGSIPNSVANLTELTTLFISDNPYLSGNIPQGMLNLHQLQYLDLSENDLTGSIPKDVFLHLHRLRYINLRNNMLNGSIPNPAKKLNNNNRSSKLEYIIFDSNIFTGTLPKFLNDMPHLSYYSAYNNLLTGTIPTEFGIYATGLTELLLAFNQLNGTIPASLGNITYIETLNLACNQLTGTIPSELSKLHVLKDLLLNSNRLNGSIPDSFSSLSTSLTNLILSDNYLIGTIPYWLGDFSYLTSISVCKNKLTGNIPASICNVKLLESLEIYNNLLTGSIPKQIGNLNNLLVLNGNENKLNGTIPNSVGDMKHLTCLQLASNQLTGAIPKSIGILTDLILLDLSNNFLYQTIPNSLGNLANLVLLSLDFNLLTGTISPKLFTLQTSLEALELSNNQLHGSIPATISNLVSLNELSLQYNKFTGTIPNVFNRLQFLNILNLAYNQFTGTIPSTVGQLTLLSSLYLNDNLLSGTVPNQIFLLPELANIFIQYNRLSGSLHMMFTNISLNSKRSMNIIQLNDNLITGTLPNAIFEFPSLTTFVAVGNCLHGTIPDSVCNSTSLKTLALDGLESSKFCRRLLIPDISLAYTTTSSVIESIPYCLFQLPSLITLHLSGNGIKGKLPNNINISNSLRNLVLSHNQLTGTIPIEFQERKWSVLDLSYNRIGGTLTPSLAARSALNSSLSLSNNMLSGDIPDSVRNMEYVDILSGNLFYCNVFSNQLPNYDSGSATYQCGSNSFDATFILWVAVASLTLSVIICTWYCRCNFTYSVVIEKYRTNWVNVFKQSEIKQRIENILKFFAVCFFIRDITVYCTIAAVAIFLPLYAILSSNALYGTHSYQYTWTVSVAFMSGVTPAVILIAVFCIVVLLCFLKITAVMQANISSQLSSFLNINSLNSNNDSISSHKVHHAEANDSIAACFYFIVISLIVVTSVNVLFVYITLYKSRQAIVAAQILLSIFKFGWNNMLSKALLHWTTQQTSSNLLKTTNSNDAMEAAAAVTTEDNKEANDFLLSHQVVATNNNNINLHRETTEIGGSHGSVCSTSSTDEHYHHSGLFEIQLFVSMLNNIAIPCIVVASIDPNCFYNIIVLPPDVHASFTYGSCLSDNPFDSCDIAMMQSEPIYYTPPFVYNYQCSASLVTYYSPTFIFLCITATFVSPMIQLLLHRVYSYSVSVDWQLTMQRYGIDKCLPNILKPIALLTAVKCDVIFDADQALISLLTYFSILLTFGLAFPPVAFAMLITILTDIIFQQLKVGRFLYNVLLEEKDSGRVSCLMNIINLNFCQLESVDALSYAKWMLLTACCWFYTLMMFDTLGSAVGWKSAFWVLIFLPTFPIVLYVGSRVISWYQYRYHHQKQSVGVDSFYIARDNDDNDGDGNNSGDDVSMNYEILYDCRDDNMEVAVNALIQSVIRVREK